jgi:opacity protein-like surface antigen
MRRLVVAFTFGVMAQSAVAADMPFLRGSLLDSPRRYVNWEGFYVGGQASYGSTDSNFTNSTKGVVDQLLAVTVLNAEMNVSSWPVLGKQSSHGQGYGGFVGYNWQWTDVVLGLEANYIHGKFENSDSNASNPMARCMSLSDSRYHCPAYTADASISIRDLGSARARAGWSIGGFLPYMFGAVSLGQADIVRKASIADRVYDSQGGTYLGTNSFSKTDVLRGHFIYGYGGGLGIDMMLYEGLFLRAEWEYLKFAAPVDTSVSTVRGGVGYKF